MNALDASTRLGLARDWSGKQRQQRCDTPGLSDSLEPPGKVVKLVPRYEWLTCEAGSRLHLKDTRDLGLNSHYSAATKWQ